MDKDRRDDKNCFKSFCFRFNVEKHNSTAKNLRTGGKNLIKWNLKKVGKKVLISLVDSKFEPESTATLADRKMTTLSKQVGKTSQEV